MDLEKVKREQIRWRILVALNAGRPFPLPEAMVLTCLEDVGLQTTPSSLRRELSYLEDRKLVAVKDQSAPNWMCRLTQLGVDVVEYTVPCNPGVARPTWNQ